MVELTDRQIKLLKVIIDEYIETAEPVGSEALDKKHNLGVSPATIRNEMVRLTQNGFLRQPHTSAGRVPTPMALKFYIQNLMQQKQMSVTDEVSVKEKIWDIREKTNQVLRESVRALAEKTHTLAIATTSDGEMYYSGMSNLLDMLEFYDMLLTKNLLAVLDHYEFWQEIFGRNLDHAKYYVLFGEELKKDYLQNCGMVYTTISTPKLNCAIGIVGPCRLNFPYVIPVVSYFGELLEDVAKSW